MKRFASLFVLLAAGPLALSQMATDSSVVDGPVHDGQEVTVDLAPQEQFKNIGSRLDGAGMCVFSSIEMAAKSQGLDEMRGWRDWCAQNYTGGGWPQRVDELLAAWGKAKGIAIPPYYQYEGKDPAQVMALIDKTGRMACITYGWSPRYGQRIAHMVCAPRYRGKYAVVLDNNFVSKKSGDGWDEKVLEWMAPDELVRRMKIGSGSAWVFCWLTPAAPPAARNLNPRPL